VSTFRRPKGTYTRPTPDFFVNTLSFAGAYQPITGAGFQVFTTISLFNNDNTGRSLLVYFISAFWDGAAVIFSDLFQGTFGSLAATATPVNPLSPTPIGQVFIKATTVAGSPPNPDITAPTGFLGLGFASAGIGFGAPLYIVRPGQSLRLSNDQRAQEAGCTFWYNYMDPN
jgi:hypothetical protein